MMQYGTAKAVSKSDTRRVKRWGKVIFLQLMARNFYEIDITMSHCFAISQRL